MTQIEIRKGKSLKLYSRADAVNKAHSWHRYTEDACRRWVDPVGDKLEDILPEAISVLIYGGLMIIGIIVYTFYIW